MDPKLEEVLLSVWRQTLVEDKESVDVAGKRFRVQETSRARLREVDFEYDGERLRGLEQNPATGSNWARLAREGKKVMQFLSGGKYIANVVDGKVHLYER